MAQAPVISEAGRSDSDAPTQPTSGMRHHTAPVSDYEGQVRGVLIQLGSSDPDGDINATRKFLEGCQDAAIDPAVCAANIYTAVKHKHGGGTILREAVAAAAEEADEAVYATTYCNRGHRLSDGKPVEHECYILPPAALRAEREGDYEKAQRIIIEHKPLRYMRRGVKAKESTAAEVAPVISERRKRAGRGTWRVTYTDVRNVRHTAVLSAPDADDAFRQAEADAKDEGRPIDRKFQVTVADHTGRAVAFHENAAEEKGECTTCIPWVKVTRDPHKHAEHMELAAKHGPIKTAKQVYALVGHDLMKETNEVFLLIPLNVRGELCSPPYEIARGQTSKVHVEAVDVIRAALDSNCESFIICHCHPTGKCTPSKADRELTNNIKAATKVYGKSLCMLDHVVIGNRQAYSISDNKCYKISTSPMAAMEPVAPRSYKVGDMLTDAEAAAVLGSKADGGWFTDDRGVEIYISYGAHKDGTRGFKVIQVGGGRARG